MKQLLYTISLLFFVFMAQAQGGSPTVQQATGMRADGKIWVVLAVCLTILVGLILYVVRLDRKISKLEKE
jgi:CcmD family protein